MRHYIRDVYTCKVCKHEFVYKGLPGLRHQAWLDEFINHVMNHITGVKYMFPKTELEELERAVKEDGDELKTGGFYGF